MSTLRVLIVRIGAMGDVLHALPAVAALREQVPEAEIEWVVDPRWAPLLVDALGSGPIVTRIHLAETRLWSHSPFSRATLQSIRRLRRGLRERPFQAIVDMQGTLRSAVVGRFAQGAMLTGFSDPREAAARSLYRRCLARQGTHVVSQGAHLLGEALGLTLSPGTPALPLGSAPQAEFLPATADLTQPLALLAPTAGWGAKQWPAAHFGTLARQLAKRGWTVLVNAARADDPLALAVVAASEHGATLIAPPLDQLSALLRRTSFVVGGDSGPVHLAAAFGIPVVALFGPTDPARNGPWGPGPKIVLRHPFSSTTYKRSSAVDPGLARITVEEVLAALDQVISP